MNIIYDKVTYFNRPLAKNLLCKFLSKALHFYNTLRLLVLVDQRLLCLQNIHEQSSH